MHAKHIDHRLVSTESMTTACHLVAGAAPPRPKAAAESLRASRSNLCVVALRSSVWKRHGLREVEVRRKMRRGGSNAASWTPCSPRRVYGHLLPLARRRLWWIKFDFFFRKTNMDMNRQRLQNVIFHFGPDSHRGIFNNSSGDYPGRAGFWQRQSAVPSRAHKCLSLST